MHTSKVKVNKISRTLREDFPEPEVVLNYVDIHPDAESEISQYLLKKDITIKTLFPDLAGTVDYIKSIFPEF